MYYIPNRERRKEKMSSFTREERSIRENCLSQHMCAGGKDDNDDDDDVYRCRNRGAMRNHDRRLIPRLAATTANKERETLWKLHHQGYNTHTPVDHYIIHVVCMCVCVCTATPVAAAATDSSPYARAQCIMRLGTTLDALQPAIIDARVA